MSLPVSRFSMDPPTVSPITSHVLDTALGCPAAGCPITLERRTISGSGDDGDDAGCPASSWTPLGAGATDDDGRLKTLLAPAHFIDPGTYRVTFDTSEYFATSGQPVFYPEVSVVFVIEDGTEHYHIPLLLSPFGYSTYRGS